MAAAGECQTIRRRRPKVALNRRQVPRQCRLLLAHRRQRVVRRQLAVSGSQRQCLALAYYHGLTHAEMAAHLGSPIGSVKAWLRRGLEKLRRCLERAK